MSIVNYTVDGELYHHGIKGQRWGDRNYQYEDGSLTPEGRRRYYGSAGQNRFRFGDAKSKPKTKEEKEMEKANSAYRVERHKAKMERKTQEALNKEKIKQAQSNAKRSAEIAKLKGIKPAKLKDSSDDSSEDKRNDKKFEKNVKELMNKKNIKDYSKYSQEEIEEAAKRKQSSNWLEEEKRKGTAFGRVTEFLESPQGAKILETSAKAAIESVGKIGESAAKQAIQSYLSVNAKEMFERSVDRANWQAKKDLVVEKLSAETSRVKSQATQELRKAESEGLKNDSQRLSNENQSMKNKQLRIENERNNAEWEAQKGVREAKNKADLDSAKARQSEAKASTEEAKARQSEAKVKQAEAKTKQEIEKSYQKRIQTDRKNFNELGGMYLNNLKVRLSKNTQAIINNSSNVTLNQIDINSLNKDELETLMKIINSRN